MAKFRGKQRIVFAIGVIMAVLAGCGKDTDTGDKDTGDTDIVSLPVEEIPLENADKSVTENGESNVQSGENTDSEMTADGLLDLFINGSINAISSGDSASAFCITDLGKH